MDNSMQCSLCQEASQYDWRIQSRKKDGGSTSHRSRNPYATCSDRLQEQGRIAWKNTGCKSLVGWILETLCAVAAIAAFSMLLLWTHGTSGTTLAQIAAAGEDAANVHVTKRNSRTGEVLQDLWISNEMHIVAMSTAQGFSLYDLNMRQKRCIDPTSGRMESGSLSDQEYTGVQAIAGTYPSCMLTGVPSNGKWLRASNDGDWEIYQLTRTNRDSSGRSYLVRFEVAIDGVTRLPRTFRLFHNSLATTGWECVSESLLEYPTGAQMRSLLENLGD